MPGLAPLEPQLSSSGQSRAISLALGPVRGGQDYKCAESDGSLFSACQVRCESEGCTEAWRRCVASAGCAVVQMNAEWTWGTLKTAGGGATLASVRNESDWRALYRAHGLAASRLSGGSSRAAASATASAAAAAAPRRPSMTGGTVDDFTDGLGDAPSNTTVAQWEAAMRSVARAQPDDAAGGADADEEHASHRPLMLTLDDVKHHDFRCPDLPAALAGGVPAACQVKCGEPSCLAAYQQCLSQPRCLAVHVNFDKTWGTLKTSVPSPNPNANPNPN